MDIVSLQNVILMLKAHGVQRLKTSEYEIEFRPDAETFHVKQADPFPQPVLNPPVDLEKTDTKVSDPEFGTNHTRDIPVPLVRPRVKKTGGMRVIVPGVGSKVEQKQYTTATPPTPREADINGFYGEQK